jgi:hypothetical protein
MFGISSFAETPFASLAGQDSLLALTGVQADGAVGTVVFTRTAALTGVSASGSLGTLGVLHENAIIAAGGWGTGTWGQAEWGVGAGYPPATSAQVGTVGAVNARDISGVQANGSVGTFGVVHTNGLLSVLALGYAGNVSDYYWTTIDTDQTPNWVDINNS